ncbi:MAG: Rieske 2Fe-2S domain-containing protein, partial [Actinobacteria bacterium]|nr:Rieske 2Fe-2S domain-containing protein [Actinomycetota bacterium]
MAYTKVCTLDELAVGTARFVQLDEPLCLVRIDEQTVHAVHDTCSHQEYPLHEGWVENGDIE